MKKSNKTLLMIVVPLMMFFGCKERTELTGPQPENGQADFTKFVSIGNSLTAGYESSSLFETGQMFSFGNLISKQVNTPYVQPLISDPGIGGQIKIVSLQPFVTTQEPDDAGTPLNINYPAPYNNLGIPGIVLADVMGATSTENSYSHSPFIDLILRGQGTQFAQASSLNPTMVTLWIGNNDVLGYATSGGVSPSEPTSTANFGYLFGLLTDGLAATGAKVAVANIPDVTTIPFFTTVGPSFAELLDSIGVPGFYYQSHNFFPTQGAPSQLADYSLLLTLVAQSYLTKFGEPSGKFYRDFGIPPALFGVDTTKAFGVDRDNPIPNALILDAAEIQTAEDAIHAFNYLIGTSVSRYPSQFAVVDVNGLLNKVRDSDATGGTDFGGIKFSTTFVTGGLFSLDGIHPTAQGYAIIANEFIKAINGKFKSNFLQVDISTVPGTLSFAKAGHFDIFGEGVYLDPIAYQHVLF